MIKNYIAFDLETTGLSIEDDYIIEIGAVKVRDGKVVDRFMEFVKPSKPITSIVTSITGISNDMVEHARCVQEVISDFLIFCEQDILVGHNIMFDYKFVKREANAIGKSFEKKAIDTLKIARCTLKTLTSKSLESLCSYYQIVNSNAHRAYYDALTTAKIYHILAHEFEDTHPELFCAKQLSYRPKKIQPCTKRQLEFLAALCAHHHIPFPKNAHAFTRSEASKKIDEIITIYGRMIQEKL